MGWGGARVGGVREVVEGGGGGRKGGGRAGEAPAGGRWEQGPTCCQGGQGHESGHQGRGSAAELH